FFAVMVMPLFFHYDPPQFRLPSALMPCKISPAGQVVDSTTGAVGEAAHSALLKEMPVIVFPAPQLMPAPPMVAGITQSAPVWSQKELAWARPVCALPRT